MDAHDLEVWFTHFTPRAGELTQFNAIRAAGLALAQTLLSNTPAGADLDAAVRHVRAACHTAISAIVSEGR